MRPAVAFDTHAFVKKLVAAGVPMAQAEVQAEALAEIALANLATKDDLANTETRLKAYIEAELRKQMLWFFTAQVALFGALAALIKLF
jgi:hypothetical protein